MFGNQLKRQLNEYTLHRYLNDFNHIKSNRKAVNFLNLFVLSSPDYPVALANLGRARISNIFTYAFWFMVRLNICHPTILPAKSNQQFIVLLQLNWRVWPLFIRIKKLQLLQIYIA